VAAVRTDPKDTQGASPDPSGTAFRHLRWKVWRAGGGIGTASGGQLVGPSASAQAGLAELDALARRRQPRGYAMARSPQTGASVPLEGR
jgi:hypothetical protein